MYTKVRPLSSLGDCVLHVDMSQGRDYKGKVEKFCFSIVCMLRHGGNGLLSSCSVGPMLDYGYVRQ
jgi:hypothetical protein